MHYWNDYIYLEIIDPVTGENLPDGEIGEIASIGRNVPYKNSAAF